MTKHQARLEHLVVKLEAMYGVDDVDVVKFRDQCLVNNGKGANESHLLRYQNLPVFDNRAARLARIPGGPL